MHNAFCRLVLFEPYFGMRVEMPPPSAHLMLQIAVDARAPVHVDLPPRSLAAARLARSGTHSRPVERMGGAAEDFRAALRRGDILAAPQPVLTLLEQDDRHVKRHPGFQNVRRTRLQTQVPALRPVYAGLVPGPVAKDLGSSRPLDHFARGGVDRTRGHAGFDRRD